MRTKTHISRLRKLANHLNAGKLLHDYSGVTCLKFRKYNHMYFLNSTTDESFLTLPYVILELPYLFPEHYAKTLQGTIRLNKSPGITAEWTLPWFFGLNTVEFENLFIPGGQKIETYGSNMLSPLPTANKVAYNIHKFIRTVEHEVHWQSFTERKVIVEKLRINHPDKIFKELEIAGMKSVAAKIN